MNIIKAAKGAMIATKFFVKKNGAAITLITGTTCLVGATVTAAKRTPKYYEAKKANKAEVEKFEAYCAEGHENYTEADLKQDKRDMVIKGIMAWVKAYYPTLLLTASGISLIIWSNQLFRKQIAMATAAATAIAAKFEEYRRRVIEEQGEAADNFYLGRSTLAEFKQAKLPEGESEAPKLPSVPPVKVMYAYGAKGWTNDKRVNMLYLQSVESMYNAKLKANKVILLNDVFDALNLPRTPFGSENGWVYDPKDENRHNEIDFGIIGSEGDDADVQLIFNVDGKVNDRLDERVYERACD